MKTAFEEKNLRKIRILVAPLDWGLGHATRCIPVINEFIGQGCEVWLAGEGTQEILLKQEFPDLPFLSLPGYQVKYGRSAGSMLWSMLSQSRKILKAIKQENNWLKKILAEHSFDAVISDNRYGLYNETIPCIFITHQLTIKSPLGKWVERLLQKRNYHYINRFKACWVPDEEGENNLAGELSHPLKKPVVPVHYIGSLSRLEKTGFEEKKHHLLVILSGPEPQRSILENIIIEDIARYPHTAIIVRGLPAASNIIPSTNSIRFYNHLPAEELNKEMNLAAFIIGRSGYSTIMDITKLQKKSILIPTPGQTEQEYLGHYLLQKHVALCVSQKKFSLVNALQEAKKKSYHLSSFPVNNKLRKIIEQFIASLR